MKTHLQKFALLVFSLSLVLGGCVRDKNDELTAANLKITTQLEANGNPVSINDTITLSNGRDFNLKKFKLYISNVDFVQTNGNRVTALKVALADVGDPVTGTFSVELPNGEYNSVELGLGLDPIQNDSDPTSFPSEHPLSTFNQMYWSMLKYRFAIIEGRSNVQDSLGSNSDVLHAYHPGTDPLYRKVSFPLNESFNQKVSDGNPSLTLVFDIDEIFTTAPAIDLVTEPQTHSEPVDIDIAIKMMDNLKETLEIRVP